MRKIAVITPVRHLEGIEELLATKGQVVYYERASKDEVRKALLNYMIDIIVCNPNEQKNKTRKFGQGQKVIFGRSSRHKSFGYKKRTI